ncbi:glycoside hydrolase family 16 protein [Cocleimonas flava]|uniref:glycoside hydrolase family 16 protein n=1 Tax=Cocleimonas flava TaxID=634765 RepID=UPI0031D213D8
MCNTNTDGTSCSVPDGTYRVKKQGGNPWRTLQTWNNVVVESNTNTSNGPTVSGNTISWPNSGWYQVQRPTAQGGNPVDWNVCNTNSDGTSCTVPDGTYRVKKQGGNPWGTLQTWNNIVVGNPTSNSSYTQIFREDFNGSSISSKFKLANWAIPNRDTTNNINSCSQSNGKLNLSIKNIGNQRQTCYLISKKQDFGPGDNSTLKFEYRANVSQVKARGAWFAGWLFALGGNASTDGNKNTGAEYDVFEYMPTWNTAYNTAVHDGDIALKKWIEPKKDYGIDLTQNKYHTFSVEWNKNCMAFFIDGHRVNTNTSHVSKAKKHTIFLTMEGQTGTQWNTWNVGSLQNNLNSNPATGKIDWVKVSEKNSIDPGLCF